MAYIGNTVQTGGFAPAIDYFNGNGVTVTFTLSRPVASVAQMIVAIDNVIQNPSSSFTVAGNAITFTSAPLAGTNNIWVEYTSLITTYQGISQDPTVIGDIRATGGYLAEGDFGNSFVDGAILDYVTGNGRITVGDADGLTIYNGGTTARTQLVQWDINGKQLQGKTVSDSNSFIQIKQSNTTVAGSTYNWNGSDKGILLQNSSSTTGAGVGLTMWLGASNNAVTAITGVQEVADSTGALAFFTGGAGTSNSAPERMRISAAGYITQPFQPAFQAISSGNITPGSGTTKVSFASVTPNISSSFSTATSRFTAPVAGTYFFTGIVTYATEGSAAYVGCLFYRNGGNLFSTYDGKASGQYSQVKNSLVITLSAGDYMELYTDTNSGSVIYEGGRTYFMGYLLG